MATRAAATRVAVEEMRTADPEPMTPMPEEPPPPPMLPETWLVAAASRKRSTAAFFN